MSIATVAAMAQEIATICNAAKQLGSLAVTAWNAIVAAEDTDSDGPSKKAMVIAAVAEAAADGLDEVEGALDTFIESVISFLNEFSSGSSWSAKAITFLTEVLDHIDNAVAILSDMASFIHDFADSLVSDDSSTDSSSTSASSTTDSSTTDSSTASDSSSEPDSTSTSA